MGRVSRSKSASRVLRVGLQYHGVEDDLGPQGSLSENLIADLIEAGFTIYAPNGTEVRS